MPPLLDASRLTNLSAAASKAIACLLASVKFSPMAIVVGQTFDVTMKTSLVGVASKHRLPAHIENDLFGVGVLKRSKTSITSSA